MNAADIQLLKSCVDKLAKIHCSNGEILTARIIFVWDEYGDVSFNIVSTNRPEKYENFPAGTAHTINLSDITSVEVV